MSVAAEHLLDDAFDVVVEVLMKARRLSDPVVSHAC